MASFFDKAIVGGMFVAIVFTALAQGAVEPWSIAIFDALIILLLLFWAIKAVYEKRFEISIPITVYPIAAFLVFGVIQSISWTDSQGNLQSLSIDPESTRTAVTTLFFLLAAHVIAANFFNSAGRLTTLVNFLTIFGFILAFLGLIQLVAGNGDILWLRPVQGGGGAWVTGTFVNHNHFAGYMELLIPLPVALIILGVQKQYRLLYGFAAVLMAVSLVLSASRGAMISLAASLLFTLLLGANYNNRVRKSSTAAVPDGATPWKGRGGGLLSGLAILGVIAIAVFVGTVWMGLEPVLNRVTESSVISNEANAETFELSRGWIWKTTANMIRANPVYGIGIGAYETGYPTYSEKNESLIVDRAHNDYLQVLSDTGIIGGIIALWFLLTFVYNVVQMLRCEIQLERAIAIGSAAAVFSLLIHSVFDFNLQLPSTALLFLILNAVLSQIVFSTVRSKRKMFSALAVPDEKPSLI